MAEDKDENIIEENSREPETEEAETAEELVKEKADNEFIARENTAQVQIFIQNANFDNKSNPKQVLDLINLNTGNEKKYNLCEMEECAEFFSTCKNMEYIVVAIILSVFEIVPIGDYANLKDTLTEYLPGVLKTDSEGKETYVQQTNSYISLNEVLSVIGGKIFITDNGRQCIGYGEGFEKVLSNIWIQFPDLRKPIISWLLKTNEMFECKTSFDANQMVGAFIRVIIEDFQYARHMFERLYSKMNNLGLLARLMQGLLVNKKLRMDALNIVLKWMESENSWLWKAALLVCLPTYDRDIDERLHEAMACAIKKRMFGFRNADLRFIVLFARDFGNVRKIMAFVFGSLYRSASAREKEYLAVIYMKMIRCGYYQVNKSNVDLPFVTCDSKEEIANIRFVLAFIMTKYELYCQLRWILQAYLEEISGYDISCETSNHITAFFYVLAKDDYDYQRDILLFLSELKGRIAKRIYNNLMKIYKNRGEKR